MYFAASMMNPADPIAGSQTISSSVGFISSTIIRMICLGVRNCPLVPDAAILPNIYSYTSPIMSAPSDASSSIPSTTRDRRRALVIWNTVSSIALLYALPVPPILRKKINTSFRTRFNMCDGLNSLNTCQRSSLYGTSWSVDGLCQSP